MQLTELAFTLEEIILRPYLLTGYLDIDVKSVPVNNDKMQFQVYQMLI